MLIANTAVVVFFANVNDIFFSLSTFPYINRASTSNKKWFVFMINPWEIKNYAEEKNNMKIHAANDVYSI